MKMKYNVGDLVRIVDHWDPHGLCLQNRSGEMDKYLGTVVTIKSILGGLHPAYEIEEDKVDRCGRGWVWNDYCIAGYADDDIDQTEFVALL